MKTRFAPSPTGYLHLGNIRTALFCALLAKKEKGIFLLRIEDTDKLRSGYEFTEQLQYDMRWLGIPWQEGPAVGGENGPYFQSERQAIYARYYDELEQRGLAYPCFCSDQELAIARKVQLASGQPPRYMGTCRLLTAEQVMQKKAVGMVPTLRFRVPDNEEINFVDFVRGPQRFQSQEIGDFIIRRGDGSAAFFFCNAIDDASMAVSHVMRGEDHLTNTPRQLLILEALKLPKPAYGHIALIVGPDGSPLSKRHGSRSIKVLHKLGYLPMALINYLARVGHYYARHDFMSFTELADEFLIENLGTAPAHYDEAQLLFWQKQAVQQLDSDVLWQWMGEAVHALVPPSAQTDFMHAVRANITFPAEAEHWASVLFSAINYNEAAAAILRQTDKLFFTTTLDALAQYGTDFKAITQYLQQTLNVKGKALFQPLRTALTGQHDGPEMGMLVKLLGAEKIKLRLQQAMENQ
jgi:glutamyl-tRNA synthetase